MLRSVLLQFLCAIRVLGPRVDQRVLVLLVAVVAGVGCRDQGRGPRGADGLSDDSHAGRPPMNDAPPSDEGNDASHSIGVAGAAIGGVEVDALSGVIPVVIAIDMNAEALQGSERYLLGAMRGVSNVFHRNFGLRLSVTGVRHWPGARTGDVSLEQKYMQFMSALSDVQGALIVGFGGKARSVSAAGCEWKSGIANYYGRHLMVCAEPGSDDWRRLKEIILHELGHALGAWHSASPRSIMRSEIPSDMTDIEPAYDEVSVDVMRITLRRSMIKAPFSVVDSDVKEMARLYRAFGDRGRTFPMFSEWIERGERALSEGAPSVASECLRLVTQSMNPDGLLSAEDRARVDLLRAGLPRGREGR